MRIGVFGGTFDPPHAGHAAVVRAARDALDLDLIELTPVNLPPHRRPPVASAADRLALVALAFDGERGCEVSPREVRRGGVSYTIDTLDELAAERPAAELFLIVGADSYDELPSWRETERVQQLAHLVVLPRPGSRGPAQLRPNDLPRLRRPGQPAPRGQRALYVPPMHPVPLAARDIRERLAQGEDPGQALARAVFEYIRWHGLYGWPHGGGARRP